MQLNLPYVDVTKTAFIKLISADGFLRYNGTGIHSCDMRPNMGYGYDFVNDDKLIIIEIEIDGKIFNSINDNLMMVKGVKHETIMLSDLVKYNKYCNQLRYNNDDDYFFQPCRCEVNGIGVMYRIITKQNKDNIQYVSKTEYKDRIVEKEIIVEKEVIVYKSVEELDECPICMEDKAIISFSCCNIKYCHKCSNKLKKCGQCRKNVDLDKVRQCI